MYELPTRIFTVELSSTVKMKREYFCQLLVYLSNKLRIAIQHG
jgi:hypothetical protein